MLTAHGFGDDSSPVQVVVNADKADEVAAAMQRHRRARSAQHRHPAGQRASS